MDRISELLQQHKAVVVDVRTPEEYINGHLPESINIPIDQLNNHISELKLMNNIIVCCASGMRSKKASLLLMQNNINCIDGGSWLDINKHLNN
jgi:rhodanese-related sulfurtransferase